MSPLLELIEVTSGYGSRPVIRSANLAVGHGEIVALVGANGAGKSTLLNTVMNTVRLQGGDMRVDGRSLRGLSTAAIVAAGVVLVPERRQLFGPMSVEENLQLGAYTSSRSVVRERLDQQFAMFPILEERRQQPARTLSGGEQQMLAIARGLMSRPRLLLLDEPSLGLAPMLADFILDHVTALRRMGVTVLIVEQNARAALTVCDRGYVLENGRVAASGTAVELLGNPRVQEAYLGGREAEPGQMERRIRALRFAQLGR